MKNKRTGEIFYPNQNISTRVLLILAPLSVSVVDPKVVMAAVSLPSLLPVLLSLNIGVAQYQV